jgi:hypothetical protein
MKFLSDILAKAGLTVDGVVTLNNTATGQTPAANDNSTKLATTAWVRTFVQPYSLPIASASILGGIKVGTGLSIDSGTGILSVTGASASSIKSTQTFVVTEGQTVFTVTNGYSVGLIDIFLNGVYLSPNQSTATNGSTFTLNDAPAAGDIIDVIVVSPVYQGTSTTTDQLPEGVVNLYYTNARARAAITLTVNGSSGASTYSSSTGVLNVPTYTLAGLGGIGGSGTTGYVSKFTNSTTIGNSLIYDDGFGIGINTSSPYNTSFYSLDVNGALLVKNVGKTANITLINADPAGGGNNAFVIHTVGGTLTSSYVDIQGYYGASVTGSTTIRLNAAGGNILIGSLIGTGTRMVVASSTGILSAQAIPTISDLSGVPTSRTLTINGVTYDLTANRSWSALPVGGTAGQLLAKVDGTDYNAQWINEAPAASYTSQVKHRVKSSQAISKGQAVYVSSADGTNMIVSKASNATEGTSSKTMGLLESTVAINGTANVVTEGLIAGLDTTGANAAGDPVWLGTDGNLIYGLTNKPSAPAHLVFIGVVTRRNANNGEIFVKVQNGFELDELHDLSVKNASDGDMIKYVASTGLWTKIAASTTNIVEGTNLYYTDARVGTYLTNNSYATQTYVNTAVSNLVDAAPGTLDTLNELAAALGDDPNFATTVAASIGTKEPIITAGTTSQYWRGDKTWQTLPIYTLSGLGGQPQLNGTGFVKVSGTTVSYDNSTYYLASNPSGYITGNQNITLSGEVTGSGATSIVTTIANNAVTTAKINNGAVTAAKLATFGAGEGLSWAANTDGASIKFESTGDGGSGGRALSNLVITLIDNADEGLKVTSDNVELFFVNTNQIQYKGANLATQSYVTSQGYLTGITSLQVTNALGFTPYNATNPSGYITSSALTAYLPLAGGIMTGVINMAGTQIILSSGFAGIEYHNTSGQWEGYVGTESGTGHLRYNSRLGNHTWYSNSSQAMKLNSGGTLDIYRIRAGGSNHDYEASEGVIRMQNNQSNHNYIVSNGADWGSWNQWIRYIAGYNTWRIGTFDAAQESGDSVWRLAGRNRSSNAEVNYIVAGPRGAWGSNDRVILWNPYARYDGGSYNGDGTHYKILDAFNYNDYAPTKTGGGASGSWSINVTGTAASETLGTVTGRGATTSTAIQVNAKIGASDNNGLHLRGHSDVTHRLYYSTTRVGIILEINNTFNIDFYNNGSPSTPYTFTTNGIFTTAATINAGDSVTLQGELYLGGVTSNRYFRLVKSGTAESAGVLNYQFYTGASWLTRSTLNSSGNVTYTGTLETGGVAGIGVSPSSANILATGDAGIASSNTRFGTGQVRIGGGSDHGSNVVLSVAPGVVNFDRPGIGGGALKITETGNVGVNNPNPVQTLSVRGLFGAPVTTGTSQNGIARFGQTSGNGCLDIGFGDPYSWLQSRDSSNYSVNYNLVLQPNGGRVSIGTTNPTQKLNVDGLRGQPATSGTTQNGLFRISTLSTGYGEALDMGFHVGVDGPASYGWIQSTNQGDLSVNYRLMLNPNGGQVFIGTTTALQGAERFAVTSSTNTAILAKFTGGGNQGWGTKIWNDGTTGNNLILEFLTESSITARGSVRYDRTGDRLNIVGEGNGILFTGVGSFTGSTASVDSIRLYNTDGNYSYIRTTPASNTNNTWFDTPLGATLWLGWDNPGGARTASTYSQVYVGTGRGTTNESIRLHRGDIEGRDGSGNIKYRIVATGAVGSHTYFNHGYFGIGTTLPTAPLTLETPGSTVDGTYFSSFTLRNTGADSISRIRFDRSSSAKWGLTLFPNNSFRISNLDINGTGGADDTTFTALANNNIGLGTATPLSTVNNGGLQIARGGHTMLMLGTGNTHGGVLQASDDNLRMFMGANFYDDVSNSWSQFVDNRGYSAFDAVAEPDGGLARILVGKPNQSGYGGENIFFEAWNSNSTSYLKLRTATDNALYIANSGKIAIGGNNPSLRLSVLETGTVISGGTVTFASQAQGLEIYNNTSGTTDNLVGCWFSTGPHKTGIASGRTNAASNWAVDLRFFVHGPEIANLDQCSEKMRLGGDGTLTVTGDVVAYGSPSDIRLKTIKEKVPNALNSILKLSGYRFDWNETNHLKTTKEDIGVIAQEVADVLPELAKTNEDGFMSVRYQGLTAVLIEAVKEQQAQIESQKSEIEELKDLVKQLINR